MNSLTQQFAMQDPLDVEADFGIEVGMVSDYCDSSCDNNGFTEYNAKDNGDIFLDNLSFPDTPNNKALQTSNNQILSPYDTKYLELLDDDNHQ